MVDTFHLFALSKIPNLTCNYLSYYIIIFSKLAKMKANLKDDKFIKVKQKILDKVDDYSKHNIG